MGNDRNKDQQSGEPADDNLSSLYSQLKHEEPSSKVDKYLLRSAKEVVGRKKTSAGNPFNGDWRMPVALAAVLVLAIGITVTLEDATRQQPMQVEQAAPVEAPAPKKPLLEKKKPAAKMEKAGRRAATPKRIETGGSSSDGAALSDAGSLPQVPQSRQTQVNEHRTEMAEPAPSVDSANIIKEPAQPRALKSAKTPAATGSISEKGQTKTADQWIEQIRELVQQSRLSEARKELTDFQREYPDYELPKDLKALKS